jgi:flagellar biosynthesis/type III secretory pathway protein FliH
MSGWLEQLSEEARMKLTSDDITVIVNTIVKTEWESKTEAFDKGFAIGVKQGKRQGLNWVLHELSELPEVFNTEEFAALINKIHKDNDL